MAGGIKITSQVVRDAAAKISNLNIEMDNALSDIKSKMNALESTWQSDAGNEIRSAMNALQPRFNEYKEVVDSYVTFLNTTAQRYEETEQTVQNNASAFK